MTKSELRKIYKKRISFDSSLLVWLLLISAVLLIAMFIIEIAMLDMKIKDIVLWALLVFLATCVLLMIYLIIREELHRIKKSKKETVFEFYSRG